MIDFLSLKHEVKQGRTQESATCFDQLENISISIKLRNDISNFLTRACAMIRRRSSNSSICKAQMRYFL